MDVCVVTYRNDADRVRRRLRPKDRLLVWDNSERNLGFAAGANAAAGLGDDPLVAFVNPDGDPSPDCFAALEAALEDPAVVAAEASQGPEWDRAALNALGDMEWLSGACMVVRREAFCQVGGFDSGLFMYCEDVDLSYKLSRQGLLRHCAAARFEHTPKSRPFRALHRNYRNWLVVQRRHRRADPARMLRDAVWSLRRRRLQQGLATLTGVADYLLRVRRWA
ncbi:glycosyltransferase [Candidatus Nephthysia bennettiae]